MENEKLGYLSYNRLILRCAGLDSQIHANAKRKCYFIWFLVVASPSVFAVTQSTLALVFFPEIYRDVIELCITVVYAGKWKAQRFFFTLQILIITISNTKISADTDCRCKVTCENFDYFYLLQQKYLLITIDCHFDKFPKKCCSNV